MQWKKIYLLQNLNESLLDLEFDIERTWKLKIRRESYDALCLAIVMVIIQKPRLTFSIGITERFKKFLIFHNLVIFASHAKLYGH